MFHPYHLDSGGELAVEEQGYHEITLSTTAVANPDGDGVVIDDNPEILRYSPPSDGEPI